MPDLAVITGAASGIGFAAAERLSQAGWALGLMDRDAEALDAARRALGDGPGTVRIAAADVSAPDDVATAFAALYDGRIRLAGLVHCAGLGEEASFLDTTAESFRRIVEVNLTGTFVVGQAAARIMLGSGGGSIVNLASVNGLRGSAGRTAYGASKGGVITLTKTMATELAQHGIRVNAIAPGPVDTAMVQQVHTAATRRRYARTIPQQRYAAPAEIAATIAFLLSPEAAYITGAVLPVDGGFTAAGLMPDAGDPEGGGPG